MPVPTLEQIQAYDACLNGYVTAACRTMIGHHSPGPYLLWFELAGRKGKLEDHLGLSKDNLILRNKSIGLMVMTAARVAGLTGPQLADAMRRGSVHAARYLAGEEDELPAETQQGDPERN